MFVCLYHAFTSCSLRLINCLLFTSLIVSDMI
nr:MAG TPA: hypothetical protein [Caudoviricetes sp.]